MRVQLVIRFSGLQEKIERRVVIPLSRASQNSPGIFTDIFCAWSAGR